MSTFLWTQKQDFGPKARAGHAVAFDSRRNKTVLFGGDSFNNRLFNDTWEWDGAFWTQMADMGPASRKDHSMAFDADKNRTVIFGGASDAAKLGDTWNWDGEAWTQLSNSGPLPRSGHSMVFNNSRNTIILFGGESANSTVLGDTWEFNGVDWTQLDETGPSPRKFHAMAFDNIRHRVVLFGGMSNDTVLNDTWEWNGSSWIQTADFGPDNCLASAMTFTSSRATLYGGINSINLNPGPIIFNKSWDWDGRHWTQRQDIGPGFRWGHAMCFDTPRASIVIFGGLFVFPASPNGVLGDTWEHTDNLTPPTQLVPPPQQLTIVSFQLNVNPVTVAEVSTVTVGVLLSEPVTGAPLTIPVFSIPQRIAASLPLPAGFQPLTLPSIIIEVGSSSGQVQLGSANITETAVIFVFQPNDSSTMVQEILTII